jgi:hypothetical protein
MAPTKSDKRTNSKKVNNVNVPSGASESTTELRKASSAATPDDDYEKYKVDESLMARLSEEDQALVDEMQAKELQDFIDDRDDVLRQLPQSVQESFGTIGFAKFGQVKAWPVLVLNPFDVPPQPVRAMWRTMFARLKKSEQLDKLTCLVYWYGSRDDPNNMYSFIPRKLVKKYESVVKNGESPVVPKKAELRKAYDEMLADVDLDPAERKRHVLTFSEEWEVKVEQYALALDKKATDQDNNSKKRRASETSAKKGLKQSIPKKRRTSATEHAKTDTSAMSIPSDSEEIDKGAKALIEDPGEENKVGKKKGVVKQRTGKKKTVEKKTGSKKKNGKPKDVDSQSVTVGDEMDFADMESSDEALQSDDDKKDDDFEADHLSEDVEKDESYTDALKPKVEKVSKKSDKKATATTKVSKPKEPSKAKLKQKFQENEKVFGPILQTWADKIKKKDTSKLQAMIKQISACYTDFSVRFIELYPVPDLVKRTKVVLKEKNADLTDLVALRTKLNSFYMEEKNKVPESFKPKPKRQISTGSSLKESQSRLTVNEPSMSTKASSQSTIGATAVMAPSRPGIEQPGDYKRKQEQRQSEPEANREMTSAIPKHDLKTHASSKPDKFLKPEKKNFSIGNYVKTTLQEAVSASKTPVVTSRAVSVAKVIPAWITEETSLEPPTDQDRSLGLEFLRQMATCFPSGNINAESLALSIEKAINDWSVKQSLVSPSDFAWRDAYWERVHAIVAAVCGKRNSGTLMNLLLNGDFDDPLELVGLEHKILLDSFEGRPIFLK